MFGTLVFVATAADHIPWAKNVTDNSCRQRQNPAPTSSLQDSTSDQHVDINSQRGNQGTDEEHKDSQE